MTYSERSRFAAAIRVSLSRITSCDRPARSRMSTNATPPRSRTLCTQPSSATSAPTSSARSIPQVWVRVRSPSESGMYIPRDSGFALGIWNLGTRGSCLRVSQIPNPESRIPVVEALGHISRSVGPRDRLLVATAHIFDRDLASQAFVVADNGYKRHLTARRVLELFTELVGFRIHVYAQSCPPQLGRQRQ